MKRRSGAFCVAGLLLAVLAGAPPARAQHIYNAVTDASLTANPGSVWSYLENSTLLPNRTRRWDGVSGFEAWYSDKPIPNLQEVAKNATGATLHVETIIDPTYLLVLDPETASAPGVVVRFTAPIAGTYSLTGYFQGVDVDQNSHDVEILHNGTVLATGVIKSYGTEVPFKGSTVLQVGDTVDFVCVGSNSYGDLSTGLAAEITGP